MSVRSIRIFDDAEQVSREAASEIVRRAKDAIAARDRFTVGLSGGKTPRRLFELLAEPPLRRQVDWSRVEFFWGDERAVPPDHPESNFAMANGVLLSVLDVPEARIHRMAAESPNRDEAARAYQAEMARVFGVPADGPPPRMDVVLLGLGSDAHTASLFPNSAALGELARWVVPADGPANGVPRLTLTAATINRAACVIFVVTGHSKARAVAAVLEGAADSERLPAQLIEPEEGAVLWLLDAGAAGGLRSATRVAAEVSTGPSR